MDAKGPVLSLIPPKTLKRLLNDSAFIELPKGDVVFRQGEPCEAIFLIVSGRCESRDATGAVERVLVPGDALGERAFLNREAYRSTAVVATHCVLLRISASELRALFEKDPCFAGRFSQALAERLEVIGETLPPKRVQRIVSLLSLSDGVNDRTVVTCLARELRGITGQHVLMVSLDPEPHAVALSDWPKMARRLSGTFAFRPHVSEMQDGIHELRLGVSSGSGAAACVPPLLSHCGGHYDYVILHVAASTPVEPALECLIQSDLAYVLVQPPGTRAFEDFTLLMQQLAEQARGPISHVKPIVVVGDDSPREELWKSIARMSQPVHSFARGFPKDAAGGDRRFFLHMRRLAREIARCRIGLALSSGGAKGLAHIGVIQVLEENGIEVDCVAGASMGAYIGGLWAYGADGAQLEELARENEGRLSFWSLFNPVLPPRRGFLRTRGVMRRLRRTLGDACFCDLVRPLRVLATNLETLERVVFSEGDVADAIEASVAIPGIIVPVTIGGETLIDGGIADPLPVDVLLEMGIERIIAVNVIPPPEQLREWRNEESMPRDGAPAGGALGAFVNRHFNYFAKGNVLDTLLQAVSGAQTRVAEASSLKADILLRPLCSGVKWHDFKNPRKYIALGRDEAGAQLQKIIALAKGGSHEHRPLPAHAKIA
ncbi:MAG: patatin-like phospholipase family protein [Chthoniobacteraceae bacterium]